MSDDLEETRAAIDTDPGKPGVQSGYDDEFMRGFNLGRDLRIADQIKLALIVAVVSVGLTVLGRGVVW